VAEGSKREIVATASLDFDTLANADAELTVDMPGVKLGHAVSVSAAALDAGLVATGYVSAANEVTVRLSNVTTGAVNPAEQDFYISVAAS
jgi:hypothetical protein